MTSAAVKTAMRRGTWLVRASAESKPESPEIGLTMQFTASLDHRSPHRLGVTLVTATSFMMRAISWARGVSLPSCSPILKPMLPVSVRMAWPGSYMPALMVMTQPSVRSRPATAATRSSLIPFWKSTTIPEG